MSETPQQQHSVPADDPNLITYFAETNFRNENRKFGIKTDDRRRHMYVIGKTGMGKSTMLENMIIQDIQNGNGIAVTDPHGDLVEKILDYIPSHRINDVIYFNPSDLDHPIAFNILEQVDPQYRNLVSNGLVGVFKKIWADSWGPRLEYILINTILALLEYPGSTLLGVTRMLVDPSYRKRVVRRISDPVVKSFWVNEFNNYSEKFRNEAIAPIQNKVGQFLSSSLIRNIVGQPKSTISMRDIMDSRKIILMNLSKGRIGEENAALLGAMMITKIQLAAMSRVDTPEHARQDFFLYVDEFQNFATESFAGILSEARKYRLGLVMAHQYVEQLNDEVRAAVFGNVGTMATFRVGAADAEELEKEFQPAFTQEDIVTLPAFHIYLRLMIDGIASEPFSANTLPPISAPFGNTDKVISVSRERYSKRREDVEDAIYIWSHADPQQAKKEIAEKKEKEHKKKKKEEKTEKSDIKTPPISVESEDTPKEESQLIAQGAPTPQPAIPPVHQSSYSAPRSPEPVAAPQWSLQQPHARPVQDQHAGGVQLFDINVERPWWRAAQADHSTYSDKHYTIADHEIPVPPLVAPKAPIAPVDISEPTVQTTMPEPVLEELHDDLHDLKKKRLSFVDQLQVEAQLDSRQPNGQKPSIIHTQQVTTTDSATRRKNQNNEEIAIDDIVEKNLVDDFQIFEDDGEEETLVPDTNYEQVSIADNSIKKDKGQPNQLEDIAQSPTRSTAQTALSSAIAGGGISLQLQQVEAPVEKEKPKSQKEDNSKRDTEKKRKKSDKSTEKSQKEEKPKKEEKASSQQENTKRGEKEDSGNNSDASPNAKKKRRRRRKRKKSGNGNFSQNENRDNVSQLEKKNNSNTSQAKASEKKEQGKDSDSERSKDKKNKLPKKPKNPTDNADAGKGQTLQPGQSVHFD